jgi:four helix bundle protein
MRNFKNYEVYQMAMDLAGEIYQITKHFPDAEKYGLTSQIRRAAVSIPSNIAEGASRNSEKEFARYIEIALGSSFEVETQLSLACRFDYIKTTTLQPLSEKVQSIQRQLSGFRMKLIGQKKSDKL